MMSVRSLGGGSLESPVSTPSLDAQKKQPTEIPSLGTEAQAPTLRNAGIKEHTSVRASTEL